MAPTAAQEKVEDGSDSRSRARGRRPHTRSRDIPPPTARDPSRVGLPEPTAPSEGRSRAGQSKQRASSQRRPSRRNPSRVGQSESASSSRSRGRAGAGSRPADKEQPEKGKRKLTRAVDEGEETGPMRSKRKRRMDDAEAVAASASAATEQAYSSETSAVSSPLRAPYIPRSVIGVDKWGRDVFEPFTKINPAILDAFGKHDAKHTAKIRNQLKLVTLDQGVPHSCLDERFESIRESVIEVVLKVSKVVFGLSSYIDGNLLGRASGFLIDWDKESKIGTILTSALLIRSKSTSLDEWSGTNEYDPHAEVHVHLLDKHDTLVNAELMQFHKHYNFALYKIKIDAVDQIPSFSEAKFGQEVLVLGRDENMHLSVGHGTVPHEGPNSLQRNHYMFTSCEIKKYAPGGPVIDLNGQFLGVVNLPAMAFIPSAIILKCIYMLKKFDCIPRLHTGMKFLAIKFLDPIHREKIIRKCDIDRGLIVTGVSEGSVAEKVGIRNGDIVTCWNGETVSTTIELESILLHMGEEHLMNGSGIGSTVDVPVGIFHVRQNSCRTIMMSVKVCDDAEVFKTGDYAITAAHCSTSSDDNDDADSGEGTPSGTSEDQFLKVFKY